MRINKYIAMRSNLSRRGADEAIAQNRVQINGVPANSGQQVIEGDTVTLDGKKLATPEFLTIIFNKPVGYICSRDGQGGKTIYDLLPAKYHNLNSVGRLDKNSSGLLLLTNNGKLHQELTHPKYKKEKIYLIELDKALLQTDFKNITERGVKLDDGLSKFKLKHQKTKNYEVTLYEGRNRQIRRTFEVLGYKVIKLHRTQFGPYSLGSTRWGELRHI